MMATKNWVDAVSVVLSPEAIGKGAMVVTNQTINSGREVLKTSVRPGAFVSGIYGVLGIVESDRVTFYRAPTRRHTTTSEFDIETITTIPKVEVISAYYDADPGIIPGGCRLGCCRDCDQWLYQRWHSLQRPTASIGGLGKGRDAHSSHSTRWNEQPGIGQHPGQLYRRRQPGGTQGANPFTASSHEDF